jgi:hypothetical protein
MQNKSSVARSGRFTVALLVASAILAQVQDAPGQDNGLSCVPAPAGLVGWWQAEGNANDAAGGNNGSITGTVRFVPGEVGLGFEFDGATSAVTVPASSNLTVQSLTVEAWVFPYDISTPRPIVEFAAPTGPGSVQLWYGITAAPGGATGAPGALYGLLRDPGGAALQVATTAGVLLSNRWTHVALTFDSVARTAALYVNGVNVDSNSSPVAVQPLTAVAVNIGYRPSGSSELLAGTRHLGGLDEVSIYNRALSAAELQSIYNADEQGKCPLAAPTNCVAPPAGLVSWWRAEGNGNDAVGANNGVLTSGVMFATGEVGQAFSFDGLHSSVTVPASSSLNVGQGNGFSLEAWINPAGNLPDPIFDWCPNNAWGVHFYANELSAGYLYADVVDTSQTHHTIQSATAILVTNRFQHVALTYDKASGTARLFVNGTIVAESNLGTFTPQTSADLQIGHRLPGAPYGEYAFSGLIDEASLYSRALSPVEVQGIYQAGSAGKCTMPTAPTIISQPASLTVGPGGTAIFTVTATGTSPLGYQWRFGGGDLIGQTGSSLVLSNVQPVNGGAY